MLQWPEKKTKMFSLFTTLGMKVFLDRANLCPPLPSLPLSSALCASPFFFLFLSSFQGRPKCEGKFSFPEMTLSLVVKEKMVSFGEDGRFESGLGASYAHALEGVLLNLVAYVPWSPVCCCVCGVAEG